MLSPGGSREDMLVLLPVLAYCRLAKKYAAPKASSDPKTKLPTADPTAIAGAILFSDLL